MKLYAAMFLLLAGCAFSQQASVPQTAYSSVPSFLKLPPDLFFGEVAGVAVNSHGHIFVFSRGNSIGPAYGASAAQLLEFDEHGNFRREIGHNLYAWYYAHAVKIDKYDNIWVRDKGSDMVVKFTPDGQVAMVFGRKQEASDEDTGPLKHLQPSLPPIDGMFRQVTDMAWDSAGNTYISDGYINSRIAKFDKNGQWTKFWGEPGDQPGQFKSIRTHHLQLETNPSFHLSATSQWRRARLGRICITPGSTQFLYSADGYPGRIYKLKLDGTVVGVLGESGKQLKQFGWIHEIAFPSGNELYVAEVLNWRV